MRGVSRFSAGRFGYDRNVVMAESVDRFGRRLNGERAVRERRGSVSPDSRLGAGRSRSYHARGSHGLGLHVVFVVGADAGRGDRGVIFAPDVGSFAPYVVANNYYVRISGARRRVVVVNVRIIGIQQIRPVAVVRFVFVIIRERCKISAGDESFGCVSSVSVYVVSAEVTARYRNVGRCFILIDRNVAVVDTVGDSYVRAVAEDVTVERSAAQRVLSICETVAVGVIVERVGSFKRSAGDVESCLHRFRRVGTRKLNPETAVSSRDGSSGNVHGVLIRRAVGKFSDRYGMRFDSTAADVRYSVSAGRVIVDRIRCGTGGDVLDKSAFNVKDPRVVDRVGSVASGIVPVAFIDPGVGRAGDQFTRSLRAAVLDRQRSFIGDERGRRGLGGSSNDLISVRVDRDIFVCLDRDRGSDYVDRLVVDHRDRRRSSVGDCRYGVLKSRVKNVADLRGRFDPVSSKGDIAGHGSREVVRCRRIAEIPSVEDAVLFFGNSRCCCGRAGIDLLARNGASAVGVKGHGIVDIRSAFKRVIRARDHQFGRMIVALPDDQLDGHLRADIRFRKVEHATVKLADEIDNVAVSHAFEFSCLKQVNTVIRRCGRRIDERG